VPLTVALTYYIYDSIKQYIYSGWIVLFNFKLGIVVQPLGLNKLNRTVGHGHVLVSAWIAVKRDMVLTMLEKSSHKTGKSQKE